MAPSLRLKADRRKKATVPALAADSANDSPRVSETDIALKAFAYYHDRGCGHGSDLDDWLRAERELLAPPKSGKRRAVR